MKYKILASAMLIAPLVAPVVVWAEDPYSTRASNILPSDSASTIAPALPTPGVGPDASVRAYLRSAHDALVWNRTGEAQQALEMAETRLLTRSTDPSVAGAPDQNPAVRALANARLALGRGDRAEALSIVDQFVSN